MPRAQVPKWFVSHWWGEPVLAFLVCLQNHVKLRHLDIMHSAYWVCAYANNQWRLAGALVSQPSRPFAKHPTSCKNLFGFFFDLLLVDVRICFIFSAWGSGVEGGVRGTMRGRGTIFSENPGGGGVSRAGGGRGARGREGVCAEFGGGG